VQVFAARGTQVPDSASTLAQGAPGEECPICFLRYPSLNRCVCCSSDICTECYVQVTRPALQEALPASAAGEPSLCALATRLAATTGDHFEPSSRTFMCHWSAVDRAHCLVGPQLVKPAGTDGSASCECALGVRKQSRSWLWIGLTGRPAWLGPSL
jgi:hypothetical protein